MRARKLTTRERRERGLRPVFTDGSAIGNGLIRPSLATRITDRVFSFFSRFEKDEPEKPVITSAPSEQRGPIRMAIGFGIATLAFILMGDRSQAWLFIGTQALILFGLQAWFTWHRKHPPAKDAGSTRQGIASALIHAAGAFGAGIFFLYVVRRSFPDLFTQPDWINSLELLFFPAGLGVLTYQRRTAWEHDDPEMGIIIVAIAIVIYIGLRIARFAL